MFDILPKGIVDETATYLPAKEALERYKSEKLEPLLDTYRLWDHKSFCDFHIRKGLVLHSSEFIFKLQRLAPLILVRPQLNFPDDWGLYIDILGREIYLSGFPKGWITEFSYTLVDERNLPIEERRGWRTVLLRLLARGVLSWKQVVDTFGNSEGYNSHRWLTYTKPFRNNEGSQAISTNRHNNFEF